VPHGSKTDEESQSVAVYGSLLYPQFHAKRCLK